MDTKQPTPKDRVIEKAGSGAALAKALGLTRSAIYQWTEIPLSQCKPIEELYGIPRSELRPDIFS